MYDLIKYGLIKWFQNNDRKANPGKSHILRSNKKSKNVTIINVALNSIVEDKLLAITLDSEFKGIWHYKHL